MECYTTVTKMKIMTSPKRAGNEPKAIELKKGESYAWCACGLSSNQPFCDGSHMSTNITPHVFVAENDGTHYMCMCKNSKGKPFCDGSHNE